MKYTKIIVDKVKEVIASANKPTVVEKAEDSIGDKEYPKTYEKEENLDEKADEPTHDVQPNLKDEKTDGEIAHLNFACPYCSGKFSVEHKYTPTTSPVPHTEEKEIKKDIGEDSTGDKEYPKTYEKEENLDEKAEGGTVNKEKEDSSEKNIKEEPDVIKKDKKTPENYAKKQALSNDGWQQAAFGIVNKPKIDGFKAAVEEFQMNFINKNKQQ